MLSQVAPVYPLSSGTALQKVAFSEDTALPAGQLSNGQIVAFYTDEHALLLGVNSVTVDKTATLPARSTTITVNTASQGGTSSLLVGDSVVGSNIPTGTTIAAVGSGSVTLNNATTNTSSVTETVAFTTAASNPNYQVSPTPATVAGSASPVSVGAPYYTPAQLGLNAATVTPLQLALAQASMAPSGQGPGAVDPSGRPNFPALFISDITGNPSATTGANDWQQGGAAVAPGAVYGTWKTATETIDLTKSTVTQSLASDPTANGTNLTGSPVAFPSGVSHEGYTAALVWNISDLENAGLVTPGHTYRFYVIDHDGDQNKTGGDSGQTAFVYGIPSLPTTANDVDVSTGAKLNDSATLPGSINPIGKVAFSLFAPGDTGADPLTAVYKDTVTLTGAANPTINTTSALGDHPGGYDPTAVGTYHWVVSYTGDANNQSASSPFGSLNENPLAEDAKITIAPNIDTNVVGAPHTFTVTVSEDMGSGFAPVANAPVTVNLTSSNGATPSPSGPFSGTTDASGHFNVIFTSATLGEVDGHAGTTFTDSNSVTFTRSTSDGVGSDGGNATKYFEDEYITISPLTASNVVGASHTVTASVFLNKGDGTGWQAAPDGDPVIITLTAKNGANPVPSTPLTGTTTGGQFSATFASASAGEVDAKASTSLTTGTTTITRTTGDSTNALDGPSAQKFFEDEYITLSPLVATNVLNAPHTVTATVFLNSGDGTGFNPVSGATVTMALTNKNGALAEQEGVDDTIDTGDTTDLPPGPLSGPTDVNGQFKVTFTSDTTGEVDTNASTSLTINGVSIMRSTGDTNVRDSANAVKYWEDLTSQDSAQTVPAGVTALNDSATLVGANNPSGNLTFKLFAPANLGGGLVYTDIVTVTGNGTYSTATQGNNHGGLPPSAQVASNQPYQWTVSYSGDANNPKIDAESNQQTTAERTVVTQIPTQLPTTAGPTVVAGSGSILSDSATLTTPVTTSLKPSGTVIFYLFKPGDPGTDPSTAVYTDTVTLTGTTAFPVTVNTSMGIPSAGSSAVATAVGNYEWVAVYSGTKDGSIAPSSGRFGDEPETSLVPDCPENTYPVSNAKTNSLPAATFPESGIIPTGGLYISGGVLYAKYYDEWPISLGVDKVTVTSGSNSSTSTYSVSPSGGPNGVPQTGAPYYPPSQFSLDPASAGAQLKLALDQGTMASPGGSDPSGRPIGPSLFITDITDNVNLLTGDWQQGGTPIAPTSVAGLPGNTSSVTFVSVSETINLATGAVTASGDTANVKSGTYNELIGWNLTGLGLDPTHSYRFYVIEHDGDVHSGGDSGQACINYSPVSAPVAAASVSGKTLTVSFNPGTTAGTIQSITLNHPTADGTVQGTTLTQDSSTSALKLPSGVQSTPSSTTRKDVISLSSGPTLSQDSLSVLTFTFANNAAVSSGSSYSIDILFTDGTTLHLVL